MKASASEVVIRDEPQIHLRIKFLRILRESLKDLPSEAKKYIIFSSQKKTEAPVYVYIETKEDGTPVSAGLVRTKTTLMRIVRRAKARGHRILIHPYPITLEKGFWQRWKEEIWKGRGTLILVKEEGLMKDEAIRWIDKLVLDVDTPYEEAFPKLLEIFSFLKIEEGYEIGKTKSGNLRAVVYFNRLEAQKEFRRQKNIERLREAYFVLVELFKRSGLKLDRSFADRINHPVWFSYDGTFYAQQVAKPGQNDFWKLYRKVKSWQRKEKVWNVEGVALTERFWSKGKDLRKPTPPSFLRKNYENLDHETKFTLWKRSVGTLYQKATRSGKGRFIHFVYPSVGWAKWLGLDKERVERYLRELLEDWDDKKFQKDMRTAWRKANPIEFRSSGCSEPASVLAEKALAYIREAGGEVKRTELVRDVFRNQNWLLYEVMGYLIEQGLVETEVKKASTPRPGRPNRVYRIKDRGSNPAAPDDEGKAIRRPAEEAFLPFDPLSRDARETRREVSSMITPTEHYLVVGGKVLCDPGFYPPASGLRTGCEATEQSFTFPEDGWPQGEPSGIAEEDHDLSTCLARRRVANPTGGIVKENDETPPGRPEPVLLKGKTPEGDSFPREEAACRELLRLGELQKSGLLIESDRVRKEELDLSAREEAARPKGRGSGPGGNPPKGVMGNADLRGVAPLPEDPQGKLLDVSLPAHCLLCSRLLPLSLLPVHQPQEGSGDSAQNLGYAHLRQG